MAEITAESHGGLVVEISNGRHNWIADEPPEKKGTDTGPNPYELLLSSLAACTCVTLRLYSDHKGIPLESIKATYRHEMVPAAEWPESGATGMVDRIVGSIELTGDFDEGQRKRLQEVAQRCPVHKTIAQGALLVDNVTFSQAV